MTFAYIRFSTLSQEETQQLFAINEYADKCRLAVDEIVKDEGVSGGVSYRDRNLNGLVKKLRRRADLMKDGKIPKEKDALIVTEISRLGRAMSDISRLLEELKEIGIRLIIIKMGIDYDCANLRATDQFLFQAMAFAAELEKELIQTRTQSAIDARKAAIEKDGGFISNAGRYCTKLGREKGCDLSEAHYAAARSREKKADEWKNASPLYKWFARQVRRGRDLKDIVLDAQELYEDDPQTWCTRTGKPLYLSMAWIWSKEILPVI